MTLPAFTTPAPQTDLRAEFWNARTRNREAEARLLWAAFLRWQLEPGNRDAPSWAFLTWLCEGQDVSPRRSQHRDASGKTRVHHHGS